MSTYGSTLLPTLCSLGPRPQVLTGMLVQWLRQHFQDLDNLTDRDLAQDNTQFRWTSGPGTGVAIESIAQWQPQLVEKRPAVIVRRNAYRSQRLGIDNRMMGTMPRDGFDYHGLLWLGSHTLFCLAGEGAECEKLAAEVYLELTEFGPQVRRALDLIRFEVAEVGALALLEEAQEHFVVPISVAYAFMHSWVLRPARPRLRRIDIALLTP